VLAVGALPCLADLTPKHGTLNWAEYERGSYDHLCYFLEIWSQ